MNRHHLNDLLRELRLNGKQFAESIGLSRPDKIYHILKGRNGISTDLANQICAYYPHVNYDWLLSGEGEMLKTRAEGGLIEPNNSGKIGRDINSYRLVPVYNFDVVGGMNSWVDVVDCPTYVERYVPFTGAAQGDICVHVTGNSMMPTYSSGSLLLIRKVEGWKEYFGYGHCYVLLLKDGRRILKEIQKSLVDTAKFVLCVSYNPQNPPEELPRDFIEGVYKVIMTLTNEGY